MKLNSQIKFCKRFCKYCIHICTFFRSKTNLEWKSPNSGQLSQHTPDMVSESDWPTSLIPNLPSSQPGESLDGSGIHSGAASRKTSKIETMQQPMDETQIVQIATDAFVKELGLEDDSLLKEGKIQIREVPAGTYLMKEESHKVRFISKFSSKKIYNFSTLN